MVMNQHPEIRIVTLGENSSSPKDADRLANCDCDCDQTLPPPCSCDCDQTLPPPCSCDCDQTLPGSEAGYNIQASQKNSSNGFRTFFKIAEANEILTVGREGLP